MSYTPAPLMVVLHPWHAQALARMVPEDMLARALRNVPPEVAAAVADSHRAMVAQSRWLTAHAAQDRPVGPVTAVGHPGEGGALPSPETSASAPEWISTTAAAALIGISPRGVRYAAERGAIRSRQDRDDGPVFIDRASAEEYRGRKQGRERRAA